MFATLIPPPTVWKCHQRLYQTCCNTSGLCADFSNPYGQTVVVAQYPEYDLRKYGSMSLKVQRLVDLQISTYRDSSGVFLLRQSRYEQRRLALG